MSYPVLLSSLKNATLVEKTFIFIEYNKFSLFVLKVLYKNGLILNYSKQEKNILVRFRYYFTINNIQNIKIVSTKSNPIYFTYYNIVKLYEKNKLLFFSTSKGVLTSTDCKRLRLGGLFLFIC